jgi:hypothetical protein
VHAPVKEMAYRPAKNDMGSDEIERDVKKEIERRKNRSTLSFKVQPKIDGAAIREEMTNEFERVTGRPEHLFRMVGSMDPLMGKCAILQMDCEYVVGPGVQGDCRNCIFAQSFVMKNPEKIFDPIEVLRG